MTASPAASCSVYMAITRMDTNSSRTSSTCAQRRQCVCHARHSWLAGLQLRCMPASGSKASQQHSLRPPATHHGVDDVDVCGRLVVVAGRGAHERRDRHARGREHGGGRAAEQQLRAAGVVARRQRAARQHDAKQRQAAAKNVEHILRMMGRAAAGVEARRKHARALSCTCMQLRHTLTIVTMKVCCCTMTSTGAGNVPVAQSATNTTPIVMSPTDQAAVALSTSLRRASRSTQYVTAPSILRSRPIVAVCGRRR